MIDANTLATPLEMASRVTEFLRSATVDSLPEYTAPTRLTPVVLIDKKVSDVDQNLTKALLQTLLSIYSAHYLMAVNMELNVGDVNVMRIMDKFSTDRDMLRATGTSTFLGLANESFYQALDCGVPGLENSNNVDKRTYNIHNDNSRHDYRQDHRDQSRYDNRDQSRHTTNNFIPETGPDAEEFTLHRGVGMRDTDGRATQFGSGHGPAGSNKDSIASIYDESDLAVGKILDVKVSSGNNTISIPVTVSVIPKMIASQDLIDITTANAVDKSFSGRWHAWRSGEIRFVKDYLLCLDLQEADRKALMADNTGTLLAMRSKRTKGILAALVSGRASPNAVSTMVVVSKDTAQQMEFALKGKFSSGHVRDQWFSSTIAMMLVVVDTVMERFTIYQRGIGHPGTYTLDDIKRNNKSTAGSDIETIMKAYKLGQAPSL